MNLYLGLDNYDDVSKEKINNLRVSGFIVGDPFCQYKMFENGNYDLIRFIDNAIDAKKDIIYQIPAYVTDRNFSEVTKTVLYLYRNKQVTKFLVQDIGVVNWIKENIPGAKMIWGHWGRNRNLIMNHDFISFLINLNVDGIESNLPDRIKAISDYGFPVYAVYGNTIYNTVSRDCYNQYMLNHYDGMCKRECLQKRSKLRSKDFEMTIDGHLLGKKIKYPPVDEYYDCIKDYSKELMLYCSDYDEACLIVDKLLRNLEGNLK